MIRFVCYVKQERGSRGEIRRVRGAWTRLRLPGDGLSLLLGAKEYRQATQNMKINLYMIALPSYYLKIEKRKRKR